MNFNSRNRADIVRSGLVIIMHIFLLLQRPGGGHVQRGGFQLGPVSKYKTPPRRVVEYICCYRFREVY